MSAKNLLPATSGPFWGLNWLTHPEKKPMAVALEKFVKQLEDSGIVAPGTLENFVPPKAHPKDAEELARQLIKAGNLTPFQAQHVIQGKAKALILGNYTILDKIGAGGMGQVFKAEHRRMKRTVAIKMLPPAVTKDAAAVARFLREVEAAAKLSHPNIVAAYDADEANGAHFLVMEYVEGQDLSALVRKSGPLPVGKAINYILQAARGLEFAHGEGVVHRDIKPANLLLDKKGVVKILDMGLARIESGGDAPAQAELTGTGAVMGTVDYMAPEQALNTKHADQRADIYSLGISLYYLIAGKAAYVGDTTMEKLLAHREQPIPSLLDAQANVPKQLGAVFRKMVAKKVEDRYQTMSEVVAALEGLAVGGPGTSSTGEAASALPISPGPRETLSKTASAKSTTKSLTEVVASEKTKHLFAKIVGGSFATIIAPILVTFFIKYLEKDNSPPNPPAATVPAATLPPALAENNRVPSSHPDEGADMRGQDPRPSSTAATGSLREPPASSKGAATRTLNAPSFEAWMQTVATMPAEKQVEALSKKLMELNPGFDGRMTGGDRFVPPRIENGVVTELGFVTDNVTDISPVRALHRLRVLTCSGTSFTRPGKLADLSPLKGMRLTKLGCSDTQVSDLSPLHGMPLTWLGCGATNVFDLTPLKGMQLATLWCSTTQVSDLSPLAGMPLGAISIYNTQVSDLSPLKGTPLWSLACFNTKVFDMSPLEGMNLTELFFAPQSITKGLIAIRQMKSLKIIVVGGSDRKYSPAEFWKKYDAGEFGTPQPAAAGTK
jgi:serine/threonine protein kinase